MAKKEAFHGLIRKNKGTYPPLGGAGGPQVGGAAGRGGSAGSGHRVYRVGAALYHRRRYPRRYRAHFDGSHRSGCRSAAVRHAAAGRARRSRLVPDRGRGAAGRPARLHGAGHGGRRNAGADRHRHAHNGGAA